MDLYTVDASEIRIRLTCWYGGSIPWFIGFFLHPTGGFLGFLNHQQYVWSLDSFPLQSWLGFLHALLLHSLWMPPKRDATFVQTSEVALFTYLFENLEPEISCEIQLLSGIKFCKLFGMGHFDLFPYRRDTLQIHTFGGWFFFGWNVDLPQKSHILEANRRFFFEKKSIQSDLMRLRCTFFLCMCAFFLRWIVFSRCWSFGLASSSIY